ncbi:hypothetical protein GALL_474920 [mine drainage metagenome]|uniref:DNA repair protein RadA n=1 Tax=mine drainage metagenome TaxID=410659 RepID=A0A1J5Q064_9ZZZZ
MYVSTVGGARVVEPAADLAIAMATVSAGQNVPLEPGLIALGEVGLAGEIRQVAGVGRRLSEAARWGFTRAVVPPGSVSRGTAPDGMQVLEVEDLAQAMTACVRPRSSRDA